MAASAAAPRKQPARAYPAVPSWVARTGGYTAVPNRFLEEFPKRLEPTAILCALTLLLETVGRPDKPDWTRPITAADLAERTHRDEKSCRDALEKLTSIGLFDEDRVGRGRRYRCSARYTEAEDPEEALRATLSAIEVRKLRTVHRKPKSDEPDVTELTRTLPQTLRHLPCPAGVPECPYEIVQEAGPKQPGILVQLPGSGAAEQASREPNNTHAPAVPDTGSALGAAASVPPAAPEGEGKANPPGSHPERAPVENTGVTPGHRNSSSGIAGGEPDQKVPVSPVDIERVVEAVLGSRPPAETCREVAGILPPATAEDFRLDLEEARARKVRERKRITPGYLPHLAQGTRERVLMQAKEAARGAGQTEVKAPPGRVDWREQRRQQELLGADLLRRFPPKRR